MGYVIKDSHGLILRYLRFENGHSVWFSSPRDGSFVPVIFDDYVSAQCLAFICDQLRNDNHHVYRTRLVSVKKVVSEPIISFLSSVDPDVIKAAYESVMRRSDHG